MQAYILGIDIGTGSTKAVAVALTGEALGVVQQHYPISNPQPGYSEQDPLLIWDAFVQCLREIILKIGYAPGAVSFSSAMHSIIPVDEAGLPLAPMITWADARSENIAESLRASAQGEDIYRITGTPVHAMSPLCKLMWLRENKPQLFAQTHKFISIKEFIWYRLFNEFEVDYSIASATGLFDILKLEWSVVACALAGVNTDKLSTPVNTTYYRSNADAATVALTGISTNTNFIIGASDGCCANLGSHTTGPGMAALTIGTSGAVRITSTTPVYNYAGMTFNYLLNQNSFVCGGAVNNGGIAINWLLKSFLQKENLTKADYDALFDTIQTVPAGSDGLLFLPYLYGERAPIWDTKSTGAYINIKPTHSRSYFLRAALEGICFALYDVLKTVEDTSETITQVNISGGFVTSPVWTQVLADITGKKLVVLQPEDASAVGAVYLAMQALHPESYTAVTQISGEKVIEPNMENHARYSKLFPVFKKLYRDLKDSMHLLHDLDK
ncbi:gluconate kinase, FGGY family [Mucilaginibacter pineti]|uniref:Gluconate kinase, FGGY family n=1 Tax=Mucilaginibacter pineti TaxID=1391627 RepID=A0A1G7KR31_9SPHI|nr:gluconokinase [Mucilaginibacter pineti]SDF39667.1 gluconate kinase, FGGY family [Mucilaginibacter pineti]